MMSSIGIDFVAAEQAEPTGGPAAAAEAIIAAARSAGDDDATTVLALGAMTNLAAAAQLFPAEFRRHVHRVIFIADTDNSRQSYNVALDPDAVRVVLRSGVELVLIGTSCYVRPAWVEALFRSITDGIDDASSSTAAASSAVAMATCESDASAARALRFLGRGDPYSMCYDPLALLFALQSDAFELPPSRVPVRVTLGTDWRFEVCSDEDRDGYALEPSAVSLERYEEFLRSAASK